MAPQAVDSPLLFFSARIVMQLNNGAIGATFDEWASASAPNVKIV
jgi:hypothetical protein